MNKLCKLNFKVFYHVLSYKSATGYQGFFEYGVYFFKTLYFLIFNSIIR